MQLKEDNDIKINGADNVFNSRANDIFAALSSSNSDNPHFRLPTGPARRSTIAQQSTSQISNGVEESSRTLSISGYRGSDHHGSEHSGTHHSDRDRHSNRDHPYGNHRSGHGRDNGAGGGGGNGFGVARRTIDRRRNHRTPDHRVHPERWTRHNLESVDETTNNRQIAFAFRESQARLREPTISIEGEQRVPTQSSEERVPQQDFSTSEDIATDPEINESDKLEFRRPSTSQPSTSSSSSRALSDKSNDTKIRAGFNTSKLVMPEYQIGVKKKQKDSKRQVSLKINEQSDKKKSSISLGHLMDDEEEEENE